MSGLLQYSGVVTKLRAMESKLLKQSDYEQLSQMENVPAAVAYLKQWPAYEEAFHDLETEDVHRGEVEKRLKDALFSDFKKIFRFADRRQDDMLDFYFVKYEIEALKACIRHVILPGAEKPEYERWKKLFDKHGNAKIDIVACSEATTLEELLEHLKGSGYYVILSRIYQSGRRECFDYVMAMDFYHFSEIWRRKDKLLEKKELEVVTNNFGVQIDLLNLIWIVRAKKYYDMTKEQQYALLIPVSYKLKREEIRRLVESNNEEELNIALEKTYYGKEQLKSLMNDGSLEQMYKTFLNQFQKKERQKHPYSIASINSYLFAKEQEIENITTLLESIRYGIDVEQMMTYIAVAQ